MLETWEELEKSIIGCEKCKIRKGRKNIVFDTGNKNATMMFIGEGPGADEDTQGELNMNVEEIKARASRCLSCKTKPCKKRMSSRQ